MIAATKERAKVEDDRELDGETLFKSTCQFGSGGWNKNGGKLGCKIPAKMMGHNSRENYLVNTRLKVIVSANPETDDVPTLPGMEDAYPSLTLSVKVNQYAVSASHVTFSMGFDRADMPADFLKDIACSAGSLYVLDVSYDEDENEGEDFNEELDE